MTSLLNLNQLCKCHFNIWIYSCNPWMR